MNRPLHIGILTLAAAVGGCKVDQAKEVRTYRALLDAGSQPVDFRPGQPLSLQDALTLANQHNERLALQGEDYLQALIDKRRAAAAFLPTLSLTPSWSVQDVADGSGTNRRLDVPVNLRSNLFNGFSDVAGYRAAARTIEQQRALLLDLQAAVLLEVAGTYYQILLAEQSVQVLENSLKVQDERLRDTVGRLKAGFGRALDVAQTEAQVAATRVALLAAENDVRTGRSALSLLAGVAVGDAPLLESVEPPATVRPIEELLAEALQRREDLAAARAAIQAARFDVDAAVGRYYPSITLNVNAFLERESNPTDSDWNALLSANLPIFSAGLIEADVRTAWSRYRQATLAESLTRRQVHSDVEIAYYNLVSSRQRIDELAVQVEAAEKALRQAEQSYKAGIATNLERLTAQDALLAAQLQQTAERYDHKVFYLTLLRAVGRLSTHLPGEAAAAAPPEPILQSPATLPATTSSPTTVPVPR